MSVISTDRLTKFYGSQRGIEDVTMAIEPGEVFGFLGPERRGEDDGDPHACSTSCIRPRAAPESSGSIRGATASRSALGLGNLPGDFGYGKLTTGRQAVSLLARLREMEDLGRTESLATRFRADLERPLGQLSRGNRQKIGLILALFHEPDLLILDEPTSGLDPLIQEEFLALVREERERGCAVFISSHELDEVERVCDRVGIIRGGKLIAVERVGDLLARTPRRASVQFAEPIDRGRATRVSWGERPGGRWKAGSASSSWETPTR